MADVSERLTDVSHRSVKLKLHFFVGIWFAWPAFEENFFLSVCALCIALFGVYGFKVQRYTIEEKGSVDLVSFLMVMGVTSASLSIFLKGYEEGMVGEAALLAVMANMIILPSLVRLYWTIKQHYLPNRWRVLLIVLHKATKRMTRTLQKYEKQKPELSWFGQESNLTWMFLKGVWNCIRLANYFRIWILLVLPGFFWISAMVLAFVPWLRHLTPDIILAVVDNLFVFAVVGLGHQLWLLWAALVLEEREDTGSLDFWNVLSGLLATVFWFVVLLNEDFPEALLVSGCFVFANTIKFYLYLRLKYGDVLEPVKDIYDVFRNGGGIRPTWRYIRHLATR